MAAPKLRDVLAQQQFLQSIGASVPQGAPQGQFSDAQALTPEDYAALGIDPATMQGEADIQNTFVPGSDLQNFQDWKVRNAPNDSGYDYDLKGAYVAGEKPASNGHWSDQFKKTNHPTFSDESQYANMPGADPGHWVGHNHDQFVPGAFAKADAALSDDVLGHAGQVAGDAFVHGTKQVAKGMEQAIDGVDANTALGGVNEAQRNNIGDVTGNLRAHGNRTLNAAANIGNGMVAAAYSPAAPVFSPIMEAGMDQMSRGPAADPDAGHGFVQGGVDAIGDVTGMDPNAVAETGMNLAMFGHQLPGLGRAAVKGTHAGLDFVDSKTGMADWYPEHMDPANRRARDIPGRLGKTMAEINGIDPFAEGVNVSDMLPSWLRSSPRESGDNLPTSNADRLPRNSPRVDEQGSNQPLFDDGMGDEGWQADPQHGANSPITNTLDNLTSRQLDINSTQGYNGPTQPTNPMSLRDIIAEQPHVARGNADADWGPVSLDTDRNPGGISMDSWLAMTPEQRASYHNMDEGSGSFADTANGRLEGLQDSMGIRDASSRPPHAGERQAIQQEIDDATAAIADLHERRNAGENVDRYFRQEGDALRTARARLAALDGNARPQPATEGISVDQYLAMSPEEQAALFQPEPEPTPEPNWGDTPAHAPERVAYERARNIQQREAERQERMARNRANRQPTLNERLQETREQLRPWMIEHGYSNDHVDGLDWNSSRTMLGRMEQDRGLTPADIDYGENALPANARYPEGSLRGLGDTGRTHGYGPRATQNPQLDPVAFQRELQRRGYTQEHFDEMPESTQRDLINSIARRKIDQFSEGTQQAGQRMERSRLREEGRIARAARPKVVDAPTTVGVTTTFPDGGKLKKLYGDGDISTGGSRHYGFRFSHPDLPKPVELDFGVNREGVAHISIGGDADANAGVLGAPIVRQVAKFLKKEYGAKTYSGMRITGARAGKSLTQNVMFSGPGGIKPSVLKRLGDDDPYAPLPAFEKPDMAINKTGEKAPAQGSGKPRTEYIEVPKNTSGEPMMAVRVNPSMIGLKNAALAAPYGEVRLLRDPNTGDVYAWPADYAIHRQVSDALGDPFQGNYRLQEDHSFFVSKQDIERAQKAGIKDVPSFLEGSKRPEGEAVIDEDGSARDTVDSVIRRSGAQPIKPSAQRKMDAAARAAPTKEELALEATTPQGKRDAKFRSMDAKGRRGKNSTYLPDDKMSEALSLMEMFDKPRGGKGRGDQGAKNGIMATPNLRDMTPEQAMETVGKQPHLIQDNNKQFIGAPRGVKSRKQIEAMRAKFDAEVEKGLAGAQWYGRAREANARNNSGAERQSLSSKEQALMSAQAAPDPNMNWALQLRNDFEAGVPSSQARTGMQADTYLRARTEKGNAAENLQDRLGKKTGIYGEHLDPNVPFATTGTNDIWHARQFGYTNNDGSTFSRALTAQEHRFLDYETVLAAKRANERKMGGRTDWTAAEIQAAPWVAGKGAELARKSANKKTGRMTEEEGIAAAGKTYPDYEGKYTANVTRESWPSQSMNMFPEWDMSKATPEERALWDQQTSSNDAGGRNQTYAEDFGMNTRPTQRTFGSFEGQNNPVDVSRPLVHFDTKGGKAAVGKTAKGMLDMESAASGLMDFQDGSAWHKVITHGGGADKSSLSINMGRVPTVTEMQALEAIAAKHGFGLANADDGVSFLDFGGASGKETAGKLKKGLQRDVEAAVGPAQIQRGRFEGGYHDLSGELKPENAGQGKATEKTLAAMDEAGKGAPNALKNLKYSKAQQAQAAAKLDRILRTEATKGPARADVKKLLGILKEGGWKGLYDHVQQFGTKGLPAVALPLLLQQGAGKKNEARTVDMSTY